MTRTTATVVTTLLLVVASPSLAQIGDGSFEISFPGSPPGAPWVASWPLTTVHPTGGCPSEPLLGLPSHQSNWCEVVGNNQAVSTMSDYRTTASSISQSFSYGNQPTTLTMDVAFVNAELPQGIGSNDFMIVEVESGGVFVPVWSTDSFTGNFPQFSTCGGDPATALQTASIDLATAFPGSTSSTVFTLWVFVGNGPGGLTLFLNSSGYVDNVRLGFCNAAASYDIQLCLDPATNLWTLATFGPTYPGEQIFNLVSLTPATPTGSGQFFGLNFTIEIFNQITLPLGVEPFHTNLDAAGFYSFGPFPGPGNLQVDIVSVVIQNGLLAEASPARTKFL